MTSAGRPDVFASLVGLSAGMRSHERIGDSASAVRYRACLGKRGIIDIALRPRQVPTLGNVDIGRKSRTLRDAIGKAELGELLSEREKLGHEIQRVVDRKTDAWGITIQGIEIRDIIIPKALEDAMSRRAQAERERQSRVILGTAETEIAEKFASASEAYRDNPVALHLRAMNMVFEGLKQKGSMIIVPSTAVETMGLGSLGGLTAFDRSGAGGGAVAPGPGPDESTD